LERTRASGCSKKKKESAKGRRGKGEDQPAFPQSGQSHQKGQGGEERPKEKRKGLHKDFEKKAC